jgi:hypothetical protein
MQLAHHGGQRHVHQGRVQVDEERPEQQRGEDHGFGSHCFPPGWVVPAAVAGRWLRARPGRIAVLPAQVPEVLAV